MDLKENKIRSISGKVYLMKPFGVLRILISKYPLSGWVTVRLSIK